MSCPKCGEEMNLFGTGGGEETSRRLSQLIGSDVPLMGKVPFNTNLREGGDEGVPLPISNPDAPSVKVMNEIVDQLLKNSQRSLAGKVLKLAK